jgi:hypothetical protein
MAQRLAIGEPSLTPLHGQARTVIKQGHTSFTLTNLRHRWTTVIPDMPGYCRQAALAFRACGAWEEWEEWEEWLKRNIPLKPYL